eukprot:4438432-Pleurochrysis_carterae.AAC.1
MFDIDRKERACIEQCTNPPTHPPRTNPRTNPRMQRGKKCQRRKEKEIKRLKSIEKRDAGMERDKDRKEYDKREKATTTPVKEKEIQ